ncbi:MAG: T9SS type A sorting domain-containing protein [Bacteroidales bacterium]|nr:T9SS type A sorting domain-containing protein [Bacteroidales bacterium]MDD4210008.1 T9SS type A sorting domain-containing protein [Bacteroidales bacterium]
MKKFILLPFLAVGFLIANSQEITDIGYNNSGTPVNLNGMTFNNVPQNTQISFPIIIYFKNTGADLNSGDSLYLDMQFNENALGILKIFFDKTFATNAETYIGINFNIQTSAFKETNTICCSCIQAIRSGVEETLAGTQKCVTFTVLFANSITEIADNKIKTYPNPVKENLYIENAENSNIYVYNTLGKLLKKVQHVSKTTEINVSDLSNGMYVIKIQNGTAIQTKKIQILK